MQYYLTQERGRGGRRLKFVEHVFKKQKKTERLAMTSIIISKELLHYCISSCSLGRGVGQKSQSSWRCVVVPQ